MIKVRVDGLPSLFLEGVDKGEDDRYIYIIEEGSTSVTRIPRDKVLYIKEMGESIVHSPIIKHGDSKTSVSNDVVKPQVASQQSVVREAAKEAKNRKNQKVKEVINEYFEKMKSPQSIMRSDAKSLSGLSQIDPSPPPPNYDPEDLVAVDVIFEGAKQGGFRMDVPQGVMNKGYTPALGRYVFSHQETKDFLNGVILDGVPTVENERVVYKTKKIEGETPAKAMGMQDKLKLAGAAAAMGTTFNQQKGQPPKISTPLPTSFSMTASPFDALPNLSLNEDNDK